MSINAKLIQSSVNNELAKKRVIPESGLTYEEACILIDREINPQNSVFLQTKHIDMGFYFLQENNIEVEINDERNGFWAIAQINPSIAKEIIKMAIGNEHFDNYIPSTKEEWGAFGRND